MSSLQEGLNRLLKGEFNVLLEPSIVAALPETIIFLIDNRQQQPADKLIEQVVLATRNDDKAIRGASSTCLVASAVKLCRAAQWDRLGKVLPALQSIVGSPLFSDQVRSDAEKALQMAKAGKTVIEDPQLAGDQKPKDPLTLREEEIFQLAAKGNTDAAKKQLFDLVVSCARKKDFSNAERLRERIYEIDPMALMEIIQSGDIIEEEKSGAISSDHLQIWANLLKVMTVEEFNAIYHEMEERAYKPEEVIISQGSKNDKLFFINQGSVRVSHKGGEKELFVKNLESGDIAGENFFNASVCTVSLTAQQQTSISVLNRESMGLLEQRMPGIESKLLGYYSRYSDLYAEMKKKGMDRRIHERYKLDRKIQLQIVDDNKRVLSSFKGALTDISQGGLSFSVRITKKENSRLLLGRNILISIPMTGLADTILGGLVIGVQVFDLVLSDYSVHVKFKKQLEEDQLKTILD